MTSVSVILGRAPKERPAVCARCGANFRQFRLAESWLEAARAHAPLGRAPAIDRLVPDGWVPVYCPPCEHRELTSLSLTVPPHQSDALDRAYVADERAALQAAS